ncbi:MAG: hypothetical protein QOJ60_2613 [Actinomycetota bacterium]|jgi:hypothetical protein|nr:hypothetical protein [Actinomycetota bacterium]
MTGTAAATRAPARAPSGKWSGEHRPYDLVKEFVIAVVVVTVLTVALAALFSSPDEKQIDLSTWAKAAPGDFALTAAAELDGSSGSATYGAPYTNDPGAAQKVGPFTPQNWFGVTHPVDTAQDFVIRPLSGVPGDPALTSALAAYQGASPAQQLRWATAYDAALAKAPGNDAAKVGPGSYGPVPVLLIRLQTMARSGGLDGALLSQGAFYQTDYTKPLLFIADGTYLEDQSRAQHLGGDQWGMMNETGAYPGQAWLWLYTFWYQVKPFSTSENADALVWVLMMLLTLVFVTLPFIPGLRSLPKYLGVHKLIWRDYYRSQRN